MAEFGEVMKKKEEMCAYYADKGCIECPIHFRNNSLSLGCATFPSKAPGRFEEIVMAWENPNAIDWSKVPEDTKVLVSNDNEHWYRRHFAEYMDGRIYTFVDGATSWSGEIKTGWRYVKFAED